jgi:hypothetical protein
VNHGFQTLRETNRLGITCGAAIIAVLIATLWPFDPFPTNRVRWLEGANGIEFDGAGLVLSKAPLQTAETTAPQSCTLELLLRPAEVKSSYAILSFYKADNPTQLLVKQWTDGLLVAHDVVDAKGKLKRSKFDLDHAFEVDRVLLVTIASGPDGTVVYADGHRAKVLPKFKMSQSELSGQIVLGTSPVDYEPWVGRILGLAIYSRELGAAEVFEHYKSWTEGVGLGPSELNGVTTLYYFAERAGGEVHNAVVSGPDLEIPKHFEVPHKARLASPVKEFKASWGYVKDVLMNMGGFVPLGFLLCGYFAATQSRGKAIFSTILAAGTLSFVIEVLQAYVPRRVSGITDIITNTLGAAIGAGFARPSTVAEDSTEGRNRGGQFPKL